MNRAAPIGLFDSGIGGLTVARELIWRLPAEALLYVADTAHVPYGGRSVDELCHLASSITRWLEAEGCKLVVVACNTCSAVALEACREVVDVPVVGVIEGGARAAGAAWRGGTVGVIATAATVASGAYPHALQALQPGLPVAQVACPRFVPLVEAGRLSTPDAVSAVCDYLAELPLAQLDALLLGCTHYPFLAPLLRMRTEERTQLIDPAFETARTVAAWLHDTGAAAAGPGAHRWCATGSADSLRLVNQLCFGGRLAAPEEIGALAVPAPA
ncbi:MAG: glutamate racemase [Fimbriimonadaceae bacterium]|nr:glutamate racemase [Fimbriimonadaceae bacterium]